MGVGGRKEEEERRELSVCFCLTGLCWGREEASLLCLEIGRSQGPSSSYPLQRSQGSLQVMFFLDLPFSILSCGTKGSHAAFEEQINPKPCFPERALRVHCLAHSQQFTRSRVLLLVLGDPESGLLLLLSWAQERGGQLPPPLGLLPWSQ